MPKKTHSNPDSRGRVGLLDEIRGFAILCMVVYHVMYDLKYLHGVNVPIFFEAWFDVIRDTFAGAFIFISGTVCRYSSSNLKRGAQCFFIGMIVTFVTAFATPGAPVMFGILHMLGVSMMIFGLFEHLLDKIPALLGIIISAVLFLACWNVPGGYIGIRGLFAFDLPRAAYNARLLFPLGMYGSGFVSGDYFPLLPWLFLFIAGSYFGRYAAANVLPQWFYRTHSRFFAAAGRYTLWIYVLHQPVAYVIMMCIF